MSTLRVDTLQTTDSSFSILVNQLRSGIDLANNSDPTKGAALVGFKGKTVYDELLKNLTVENYGAVGDGITNDSAAFTAMSLANGGLIRLLDKTYNVQGWTHTADYVALIGARKPSKNAAGTALTGGTVLIGHFDVRARVSLGFDWGSDCGPTRGLAANIGGFVFDAQTGAIGDECFFNNIEILCNSNTGANSVHAMLVEGYNKGIITNIGMSNAYHGIVYKGRGGFIENINGFHMGQDTVFIKSDVPASGGNVADATVQNVIVNNVYSVSETGNTECNHVYVMASTAVLSTVHVSNVIGLFGNSPLRIAGGGALVYCVGVTFNNISSAGCLVGPEAIGTVFDVQGNSIHTDNPKNGKAVDTGVISNWNINNINLVLSDAAITAPYAAGFGGTGSWNNFNVRSGIGSKLLPFSSTVRTGVKSGQVTVDIEGTLTLGGNWSAGTPPAVLKVEPDSNLVIQGSVTNLVATGDSIAAVGGGVAIDTKWSCFGTNTSDVPITVYVSWTSAGITLLTPARATIKTIDLSTLRIVR